MVASRMLEAQERGEGGGGDYVGKGGLTVYVGFFWLFAGNMPALRRRMLMGRSMARKSEANLVTEENWLRIALSVPGTDSRVLPLGDLRVNWSGLTDMF